MKRIVLLTDPDRVDAGLLERLQWAFPECRIEIVAVAEAGRSPAASASEGGRASSFPHPDGQRFPPVRTSSPTPLPQPNPSE